MSVLSGLSKADFKTASDGLLELPEERLHNIMRTEPITDVYHVEQTPFARSVPIVPICHTHTHTHTLVHLTHIVSSTSVNVICYPFLFWNTYHTWMVGLIRFLFYVEEF